jgi:hypothetical protein
MYYIRSGKSPVECGIWGFVINIYYKKKETPEAIRERQRKYRVALISIGVITVVCMLGIWTVMYFAYTL